MKNLHIKPREYNFNPLKEEVHLSLESGNTLTLPKGTTYVGCQLSKDFFLVYTKPYMRNGCNGIQLPFSALGELEEKIKKLNST